MFSMKECNRLGKVDANHLSGKGTIAKVQVTISPPHSRMPFTPADFWIGDATIWGFAMMWEDGDDKAPVESTSDWNVLEELQQA